MKRRNADCGKLRRPIKRNKITEGMYGSTTILYMKFLVLWAIVITADFMFMFRFEFLWPFWLLLRSVHDSFKYKGLAFSVLFVCIAITSDLVCLFFIPVHWLLFAASTYVWVQYVWHTDKGICLPTIILWMLFVYLEAGIRWKDSRHMPHLDLCRPFAAHCIGYPVVTLGFGFKSYVGYRMRQRKQREVAKENEFYMQLLQQALPVEETLEEPSISAAAVTTTNAATITQSAQNSSHSSHTSLTNAAITATASSVSITPNGTLATHAQNLNHLNQANEHIHHNNNNNISSNNNNSNSSNCNSNNANSNNSNSSNHNNGNLSAGTTSTCGTSTTSHSNSDDKNYVQIGNGGSSSGNNSSASNANNHHNNSNHQNHHNNSHSNHHHQNHNQHNNHHNNSNSRNAQNHSTSNGHIGVHNNKNHRRSFDKENKNRGGGIADNETKHNHNSKSNSNYSADSSNNNNNNNNKDKNDWESGNYQVQQVQQSTSGREKHDDHRGGGQSNNSKRNNNSHSSSGASATANGSVTQYDVDDVVVVEPVEKAKGRRNRSKRDNASKDNHHHQQQHHSHNSNNANGVTNNSNSNNNTNNNSSNTNSNNTNHAHNNQNQQNSNSNSKESQSQNTNNNSNNNHNHNSDDSSVSSSTSSTSSTASSSVASATSTISNLASKVVSKICESCLKLEADVKKYRSEISHQKQIENELRQKLESNLTTKSCLQAKQKECEELEKRIHELTNARHADMLQLQTAERRLTEERRQKQSLDSQLNNEKKARKLAEEKAARPECSTQCKQRKQQIEEEIKLLRRDLKLADEAKQLAEQHGRKYEQELRMFEAEIRTRDSNQPGTEMLMNALAAMQDKNCTLEKNLSAETRVKLDLFSALGDAKRQLEISENRRRCKEDEVLDLKAKIAQLLAVMPTDSLCLPSCSNTGASSMLRMNDTPPLQAGPGPASPMLSSLNAQQSSVTGSHQINARCNVVQANDYVQQAQDYVNSQQQCGGVPVSVATAVLVSGPSPGNSGGSNLDPNASVYTPKAGPGSGPGGPVLVGSAGDA